MLACSSGSIDPGEHPAHVVGGGRRARDRLVHGGSGVVGIRPVDAHQVIKTGSVLKICLDAATVKRSYGPRGAQGTGRRDALRDVPGAGHRPPRRCRPRTSPIGSACTPTPSGCTSSGSARSASSMSRPSTAARSAGRSTSTSSPPALPGLGFDPPAHALLAGLLAALAERIGADADDAADTGHAWGVEAGRRTRVTQLPARARGGAAPARLRAGRRARRRHRGGRARASSSCTARSASWPRRTPSWCATCTGASARAWSIRSAGEALRSSRRCTTRSRVTSRWPLGILSAQ